MKKIKLLGRKCHGSPLRGYTLIDDEDLEKVINYKWSLSYNGYATATILKKKKWTILYMHRLIMNFPKGLEIDHINRSKLDNRKENLRICTRQQNSGNKPKKVGAASYYKGVCRVVRSSPWLAQISVKQNHKYIGCFREERHAAMAYDMWAKELFGEYAYLNFPNAIHKSN